MNPLQVIRGSDIKAIVELFKEREMKVSHEECADQYDVSRHKIFDKNYRKDNVINKDIMVNGITQLNEDGSPRTTTEIIPVARIGLPFQQQIVEQRIGFMLTLPVNYNMFSKKSEGKKLIKMVEEIQKKNRMDFKNKEVLRRQMSEMGCARLWYFIPSDELGKKFSLRHKILSPALGDILIPLYDDYGDMVAFSRKYKTKENDKEIEHCDVYTAEFEKRMVLRDNDWKLDVITDSLGNPIPNPIPNPVGKIMLVYYDQEVPEWYQSQPMIERLEVSHSNHADMNDKFGAPILAVTGQVQGFASKGEQGKIIELEQEAKANYLQLTTPPESILKEQAQLRELLLSLTNTADISFDKVKGIGNLSAVALNLLFISSTMAAKTKEETFAVNLQRELNLIMACIGKVIDTSLEKAIQSVDTNPQINVYIPEDIASLMKMLAEAKEAGTMSDELIVENNPYALDKEKELSLLKLQKVVEPNNDTTEENNL